MAEYEVLKDCHNKKTDVVYQTGQKLDSTVKEINEFEKRLEKARYDLPFFKRLDK